LSQWSAVQIEGSEAVVSYLRSKGISHIFVGRRAQYLNPTELANSPDLELLYDVDSVYVFRLKPQETPSRSEP
jgi:hypothetical protein